MTVARDTDIEAVERLVEKMMSPWALVELMMMGWAMAVLVEMAMLPFEPVEVMITGTATGVVGSIGTGIGGGVMTTVLDAGAGGTAAGRIFDGSSIGPLDWGACAPF